MVVTVKQWRGNDIDVQMTLDTSTEDPYDYVGTLNTSNMSVGVAYVLADVQDLAGNENWSYIAFFVWKRWW